MQIRKNLEPTPASDKEDDSNEKKKGSDEDNDDEEELATMEELKEYVESQKRKERKKKAKAKEKAKARSATGMQIDVMEDGVADTELFNIKAIKVLCIDYNIFWRNANIVCNGILIFF